MKEPTMDHRLTKLGFRGPQADAVRTFQATYRRGVWRIRPLKVDGDLGPATIKALNHCTKHDGHVTRYFRYIEFQCKCGGIYPSCRGVLVVRPLLKALGKMRRWYYPGGLSVVSGYRCPGHNDAVGGASESRHLKGAAADIPAVVRVGSNLPKQVGGVGYNSSSGRISHIDTRSTSGGLVTWEYGR